MTTSTTNDKGARTYHDLLPTGPAYSVTTYLQAWPKMLAYAAGKTSMDLTVDMAHGVAQQYAESAEMMRQNDDPASIASLFEDFGHSVRSALAGRFAANKDGSPKPPHDVVWRWKADTGTAIHLDVERWANARLGEPMPVEMDKSEVYKALPGEYQARAQVGATLFRAWAEDNKAKPIAAETVVYLDREQGVRNRVGCRIDLVVEIEEASAFVWGPLLLDVKSGSLEKGKPYREQRIQTEIQRLAWNARNPDRIVNYAGILHVPADGGKVQVFLNDLKERDALAYAFDLTADLYRCVHGEAKP